MGTRRHLPGLVMLGNLAALVALLALAAGKQCDKCYHNVKISDSFPTDEVGVVSGKFPTNFIEGGDDPNYDPDRKPDPNILPPKNDPGEIIKSTDSQKMNQALDQVLKHTDLMHDRGCAIATANTGKGTVLENPRFWLRSGMSYAHMPPELKYGQSGLKLFVKKDWQATGTVGIVTYDIAGTDHKVAILWSVPFDWNLYDCWFNVKIYPKTYPTGDHMYEQMYYRAGAWRAAGWESREEYGVKVTGTMTQNIQSKVMVWVDASGYDPALPHENYQGCTYHAGWVSNYCWRDCQQGGYCWLNKKCKKESDCTSFSEPCYDGVCKKKGPNSTE